MKTLKMDSSTPNFIRAELRAMFYDGLDRLSEIIDDPDARNADKIKAIELLGRYGLGSADQSAVHIHAGERSQIRGVVRLPSLDPVRGPNGESIDGQGKRRVDVGPGGVALLSDG